jgi:hypothetical protein
MSSDNSQQGRRLVDIDRLSSLGSQDKGIHSRSEWSCTSTWSFSVPKAEFGTYSSGQRPDPPYSSSNSKLDPRTQASRTSPSGASASPAEHTADSSIPRFVSDDTLYEIDPITNRKVPRKGVTNASNEGLAKHPPHSFRGYRSQFTQFTPPSSSPLDCPSQAELNTYKAFMHNEPDGRLPEKPDPVAEGLRAYDLKPLLKNSAILNHKQSNTEGTLPKYDDLHKYKPFLHNEPDGQNPQVPDATQEGLKEYDSEVSYGAFLHDEPDGRKPEKADLVQESLKDYDDRTEYGAFKYNEPDGHAPEPQDSTAQGLKEFDSKTTYGAFRHNEPDGHAPEPRDTVAEGLQDFDSKTTYGAFRYLEPDGHAPEPRDSTAEGLQEFDSKTIYGAFRYNEPDGHGPEPRDTVAEGLNDYDSKTTYGAFRYLEPDGKRTKENSAEANGISEHNSKTEHSAFRYLEIDGKRPEEVATVAKSLGDYDDQVTYGAFRYLEPDGKKPEVVDQLKKGLGDYDGKVEYGAFRYLEPDGKKSEVIDQVQKGLGDYDHKTEYGAFRYLEPDGKQPEVIDEVKRGLGEYDNKTEYGAFRYLEPDGKQPEVIDQVERGLGEYDNKTEYSAFRYLEPDGKKPVQIDTVETGLADHDSKVEYGAFRYLEPDGKKADVVDNVAAGLSDFDNVTTYGAFAYNEPDGKKPEQIDTVQKGLEDHDSKTTYGAFRYLEPDGKLETASDIATGSSGRSWLDQEGFSGSSGVGGGAGADGNGSGRSPKSAPIEPTLSRTARKKLSKFNVSDTDKTEDLDLLRPSDVRARMGIIRDPKQETDAEKLARRKLLETEFEKAQAANALPSAHDAPADPVIPRDFTNSSEDVTPTPTARRVTGNFVQDFPEEFSTSWSVKQNTLMPKDQDDSLEQKKKNNEHTKGLAASQDHSRGDVACRIETSLDRSQIKTVEKIENVNDNKVQVSLDSSSSKAQGPKTLPVDEVEQQTEGNRIRKIPYPFLQRKDFNEKEAYITKKQAMFENYLLSKRREDVNLMRDVRAKYEDEGDGLKFEQYRLVSRKNGQKAALHVKADEIGHANPKNTVATEAITYKVLAYDRGQNKVTVATVASHVIDESPRLSPSDAITHILQPAKYLPLIDALSAEGYEIVKASKYSLVFRQALPSRESVVDTRRVNPVDGMRAPEPPTGNFASPTGFVNHDLHTPSGTAFRSGIDVRREEAVFSGRKKWDEEPSDEKKGKKSVAKRVLLGAGWVAACTWAGSVVVEFFKTGGADGLGAIGF